MLLLESLFSLRVVDVIDILLFAILLYEIYNIVKGTAAIKIFIGIIAVFIIWKIVRALQMPLLSEILGQFISVGVIALVVVFQPEIRQFLLVVGGTRIIRGHRRRILFWRYDLNQAVNLDIDIIVKACKRLADTKTGALIVIARENELTPYVETGQPVEARISDPLIETIFFKNSPLHDGAMIIAGESIRAARCILPLSSKPGIPPECGLRHRAAIGLTERTDAIAIIVSEETGEISYSFDGALFLDIKPVRLKEILEHLLRE
ncbi:MAG: TIGR00159 family protein [Bacteroidetes bacterium]|nr:MAG: TIGR00159 family protein [Bacteroidota bacterium]